MLDFCVFNVYLDQRHILHSEVLQPPQKFGLSIVMANMDSSEHAFEPWCLDRLYDPDESQLSPALSKVVIV